MAYPFKVSDLYKFLDAQRFTQEELKDLDYVADKIENFLENIDCTLHEAAVISLANTYFELRKFR